MENSLLQTVRSLEGIEQKKSFLREFTKSYSELAKSKGLSVNELLKLAYKREGVEELHTFNGWKEKGFKVSKGSKSLILWSGKIQSGSEDKQEGEGNRSFFAVAHVFCQDSVEKI